MIILGMVKKIESEGENLGKIVEVLMEIGGVRAKEQFPVLLIVFFLQSSRVC